MKKTLRELKDSLSTTKIRIICLEDEMTVKAREFEKLFLLKVGLEAEIKGLESN